MSTKVNEREWQPLDTAPFCVPLQEQPTRCLLYSPQAGIQIGSAGRWPDGVTFASAASFYGDWGWTHWMPLPDPPSPDSEPRTLTED